MLAVEDQEVKEFMDEKQIIQQLKQGVDKQRAFRALVGLYKERLYWHIRRMVLLHDDADDVLQNTFIKVWKGVESFREDSSLYTWMYRIATNEALNFLEQQKRKGFGDYEDAMLAGMQADSFFDGDAVQLKLQEAIASLPEKQRLVFNMRYYDDIKYQDMEKILDTSEGALKASYHHAVRKITAYMENSDL
ncbi:MAG: RNA polymerase sigma factor [Mangrovibacterium sp.]